MAYYKFLLTKTIKNRICLISILIPLLGIASLYYLNITSGEAFSYKNITREHYNETKELESYYLEELNGDVNYSEEDTLMFENALYDISEQREWNEEILAAIEKEEWSRALDGSLKILNRHIEVNNKAGGELFPSDYVAVLNSEIVFYEALSKYNQAPDTDGYEKFGFNFVFRVMDSLVPTLFVLVLSVLLTEIYLSTYKQKINIEILLPTSFIRTTMKKLIYSALFAINFYIIILLFSLVIASLINGTGTLQYPMLIYTSATPEIAPLWIVLVKMFLLQVLGVVNIVFVIALISFIFKSRLVSLLISIITIIGSIMVQNSMEVFNSIAHLNPFTYLLSGDVVTSFMRMDTNNSLVTFETGMIILSLVSLLLLVVIYFIISKKQQKQLIARS